MKKRLLVCLLCLLSVCTLVFGTACGSASAKNPLTPSVVTVDDGLHQVKIQETGRNFVENSATDYKIIPPEKSDGNSVVAISELRMFVKEATGAMLETEEDDVEYSDSAKYISLGDNGYSQTAGIVYDREVLKSTGARVLTKGNSIFIGGAGSKGMLNAVYEFLKYTFGFEVYTEEIYDLEKKNTVPLYDYDITEVPDFEYRPVNYGSLSNAQYTSRMRFDGVGDIFMPVGGSYWHNTLKYLPKETYQAAHPSWYSTSGDQLCFTARGNEEEFAAMQDTFFEQLKSVVKNYSAENISITAEDNANWCSCDACLAAKNKYGANSAVLIKFCNEMSERLDDWIKTNDEGVPHDRVVNIVFFAYNATTEAPVTQDSQGNYVPVSDDVVCRDNVYVFYAPIMAMFNESFLSVNNRFYYETLKKWQALSRKTYLWVYQTNFSAYLYPYNNFNVIQENYKIYKSFNVQYLFDQGQHDNLKATAFSEFKYWLTYKLAWNVNLDLSELTDLYFKKVYGPASDTMRSYYEDLKTHMMYLENEKGVNGNIYYAIGEPDFFPKFTIDRFLSKLETALEQIRPLSETDPELYSAYDKNIKVESMFPRTAMLSFYSGYYSDGEKAEMKESFTNDASYLGFTKYREAHDISGLINMW
mgnify:CR=1 FL=1